MAESHHAMAERYDALDDQMYRQEWYDRWAGRGEGPITTEPAVIKSCATCRYADGGPEEYWCGAHRKFVSGPIGCSGWPWDPVEEVAA